MKYQVDKKTIKKHLTNQRNTTSQVKFYLIIPSKSPKYIAIANKSADPPGLK